MNRRKIHRKSQKVPTLSKIEVNESCVFVHLKIMIQGVSSVGNFITAY